MVAPPSYTPLEERPLNDTICLFDVDGTLTPARLVRLPLPQLPLLLCPSTATLKKK